MSLEYRALWAERKYTPEDSGGWKIYESKKHRQIRRKQEKRQEAIDAGGFWVSYRGAMVPFNKK